MCGGSAGLEKVVVSVASVLVSLVSFVLFVALVIFVCSLAADDPP
jgi:hypothetical protein